MRRRFFAPALLLACYAALFALPATVHAQRIELGARGEPAIDRVLRSIVAGEYTLITENRLVARDDTLRGTIVVARSTFRLEGTIVGDLVGLDANVFVRPTGVVTGNVMNIAGGFYPSELATLSGAVLDEPNAPYTIRVTGDVVRVAGTDARPRFELDGFRGVFMPSYDRVDGVTLGAGAAVVLPYLGGFDPRVSGHAAYRSQRGVVTGGAEVNAVRDGLRVGGGAERTTLSNELWSRPRWNNTLNYLFLGLDYFDHYEADRAWAEAELGRGTQDVQLALLVRGQVERARTLRAGNPWSLFRRDDTRANRPVDDGRIVSGIAAATAGYAGETVTLNGGVSIEMGQYRRASGELPAADSVFAPGRPVFEDGSFALGQVSADAQMAALLNHTLTIETRLQFPLGTEALPLQRWTMVGGDGTLYTYPIGAFHGDRLAWVHTSYSIPAPEAWRLPLFGPPTLDLMHVAAMAWDETGAGNLEQNIGARLRAGFVFVRLMADPSGATRRDLAVGLFMPIRSLPWQQARD